MSLGSYTRSAARATFSAYRSIPIRWRLAGGSAVLTFVILASFAAIVGVLTERQVRGQFNNDVRSAAEQLHNRLQLRWTPAFGLNCNKTISLSDYVSAEHAQIRIYDDAGELQCTQDNVKIKGAKTTLPAVPSFPTPTRQGVFEELGY